MVEALYGVMCNLDLHYVLHNCFKPSDPIIGFYYCRLYAIVGGLSQEIDRKK